MRTWPAVVLVLAALLAVTATAARVVLPPVQTRHVALPAADAGPREVVRTYLAAIDAHDCATAESLAEPGLVDDARTWCEDAAGLDELQVGAGHRERPQWSGHAGTDQVADVGVAFGLRWRAFHGDASMPSGRTVWGYQLVRHAPGAPWRISDQGVG